MPPRLPPIPDINNTERMLGIVLIGLAAAMALEFFRWCLA